jgi:hypothetical protein
VLTAGPGAADGEEGHACTTAKYQQRRAARTYDGLPEDSRSLNYSLAIFSSLLFLFSLSFFLSLSLSLSLSLLSLLSSLSLSHLNAAGPQGSRAGDACRRRSPHALCRDSHLCSCPVRALAGPGGREGHTAVTAGGQRERSCTRGAARHSDCDTQVGCVPVWAVRACRAVFRPLRLVVCSPFTQISEGLAGTTGPRHSEHPAGYASARVCALTSLSLSLSLSLSSFPLPPSFPLSLPHTRQCRFRARSVRAGCGSASGSITQTSTALVTSSRMAASVCSSTTAPRWSLPPMICESAPLCVCVCVCVRACVCACVCACVGACVHTCVGT